MTNDDDCGCGKIIKQNRAKVQAKPVTHEHSHDQAPARGLKPDELRGRMEGRGWKSDTQVLESVDKKQRVTVWRRDTPALALGHNDTLITLEVDGEAQLFRLSESKPLEMILSGKVPPA